MSGGYLIIDDVVLNKCYAKHIENLSWVYCSKEQRSVLGLNLVVLCWSNGTLTIPLAIKIWIFYTQLKKNRKFNGVQVSRYKSTRFWTQTGKIDGDYAVLVTKHEGKYFVTNDLSVSKSEILRTYKTRWKIETMFRMLEYQLGMDECQTIRLRAQIAHVYMSLMAFVVLERARIDTGRTWYDLKRELTFHPQRTPELLSRLDLVGA